MANRVTMTPRKFDAKEGNELSTTASPPGLSPPRLTDDDAKGKNELLQACHQLSRLFLGPGISPSARDHDGKWDRSELVVSS